MFKNLGADHLAFAKKHGYTGDMAGLRKFLLDLVASGRVKASEIKSVGAAKSATTQPQKTQPKVQKSSTTVDDGSALANQIVSALKTAFGTPAPVVSGAGATGSEGTVSSSENLPAKLFGGEGTSGIRVIGVEQKYAQTKSAVVYPKFTKSPTGEVGSPHPFAGMPVSYEGKELQTASDLEKAVFGAWVKYQCKKNSPNMTGSMKLHEEDLNLLNYSVRNMPFRGVINTRSGRFEVDNRVLEPHEQKTLLDDTVSGGIEITPAAFDAAFITIPLLFGQLFPFVTVVDVKSRRVKGGIISNPTFTSGVPEGTPMVPFDTNDFIRGFDTAVHPAVAAVDVGRDFMEDTPVNIGSHLMQAFGYSALNWLDGVIAVGNGTNEPLGILTATGLNVINATFPNAGPYTPDDFENLMFAVPIEYRQEANAMMAFVSNDVTYRKLRQIPRSTNDRQRLFGTNNQSYQAFDTQYKISNRAPNGTAAYGNLRRYRMYRRLDMLIRVEEGGRQNAINNTINMVVRMRMGGQPETGAAFAKFVNGDQS